MWRSLDKVILFFYLGVVFIGLANMYSISIENPWSLSSPFFKQLLWFCASLVLFALIWSVNVRFWRLFSYGIYAILIIVCLALAFFGKSVRGAHAWIQVAGLGIQPAEFLKLGTILALSSALSNPHLTLNTLKKSIFPILLIVVPVGVALLQNDTGTALTFIPLSLMLVLRGFNPYIIFTLLGCGLSMALSIAIGSYVVAGTISLITVAWLSIAGQYQKYEIYILLALGILTLSGLLFLEGTIAMISLLLLFVILAVYTFFSHAPKRIWNLRMLSIIIFASMVGSSLGADLVYTKVLKEHQRQRIDILFGAEKKIKKEYDKYADMLARTDPDHPSYNEIREKYNKAKMALLEFRRGVGYNTTQARIAVGSGGISGKGYLKGTQTKYKFVPQFFSDFAFCNWAEETGFVGSLILILLVMILCIRITHIAGKQETPFERTFMYSTAIFIFTHFFINVGMIIGVLPTIGVPFPSVSYGGSSFLTFSSMIFIVLRYEATRRTLEK